jgi:thiol-disulfide isomerase/thioredoxin
MTRCFRRLARLYGSKIQFIIVDVDEFETLAYSMNINVIPTIKVYKNGSLRDEKVGFNYNGLEKLVIELFYLEN